MPVVSRRSRLPLAAGLVWLVMAAPAWAQVQRLSLSTSGVQADAGGDQPAIDHSGRVVAFRSFSTNLVGDDTNGASDIFVRDRDADADGVLEEPGAVVTTRVCVASGGAQANAGCEQPALGADGRFVVFVSAATNLLTPPDTVVGSIIARQIYRNDRVTGETRLVSRGVTQAAADGDCTSPSVSRDGRYVVFTSSATNLVAADPGFGGGIYLRDLETGAIVRLTEPLPLEGPPVRPPGGITYRAGTATIDAAGTRIAYSVETHLWYRTFNNNTGELRVYDIATATTRPAVASGHTPQWLDAGRALGYLDASLGGPLSTFFGRGGWLDLETGAATTLVFDSQYAPKAITWSADGRYAAYLTQDPNPVFYMPETRPAEPFLFDRTLSDSWLLPAGTMLGPLDGVGRFLVFSSPATTLVAGDTNNAPDIFAIDLPALFDADADGLDDRWERTVGLSTSLGTGDDGPSGDPDGDGVSNADERARGTHPRGAHTRYLAEGITGAFFDTQIALANPGSTAATAVVRFETGGQRRWQHLRLLPNSSRTLDVEAIDGMEGAAFATAVESDLPLVVDRRVSWGAGGYGAHGETSLPSARPAWYFAEGATGGPFELFYLLQNPGDAATTAEVTFLRPVGGAPIVRTYALPPHSRTTIHVDDVDPVLAAADVSASIAAAQPIIAERAMYVSDATTVFRGGHASAGIAALSPNWFFAEGATGAFFDLFLLLANPAPDPVTVTVDYLTDGGAARTKAYTVAGRSRRTVWVDDESFGTEGKVLATAAVSMRVTASAPIAAERAMWWPGGESWREGHASAGATGTATRWAFADGGVDGPRNVRTYVLIANPDVVEASVRITLLPDEATTTPLVHTMTLPAGSRFTFDVAAQLNVPGDYRLERRFGAIVESLGAAPAAIVVERATYWNAGGVVWEAGLGALAVPLP